jgi:hypothetical protein
MATQVATMNRPKQDLAPAEAGRLKRIGKAVEGVLDKIG